VPYRTIFPWMAQETQYWSFKYIFGTLYSGKTEASEISPVFRLVRRFLLSCPVFNSCPAFNPSPCLVSTSFFVRDCGRCRRTDGGRLDHVADGESLDCLVLWRASRAVGASDGVDVTTSGLVTSAATGSSAKVHKETEPVHRVTYLLDLFLTLN